ncbi:MAG: rhodanese-like domain-containing protein [Dysgonamonadaceae bacterium]|jgi:rhodanese-related sulfurtransferase|nr:rhodanese-like domain-containing protein [Dysgonamonadaceae bacterium]
MKKYLLFLAMTVLFASCGKSQNTAKDSTFFIIIIAAIAIYLIYRQITNSQRAKKIRNMINSEGKTIVVDVRTPDEFRGRHLENSINIPLDKISLSAEKLRQYDNVIVVCVSGMRSAQAAAILKNKGLANVVNGGGWTDLIGKI